MTDSPVDERSLSLIRANEYLEAQLSMSLGSVEKASSAHALAFYGDFYAGADSLVRNMVEQRKEQDPDCSRIVFLLTTSGGELDVVHRLGDVLHYHYREVWFVIPDHAYSAGTILAMSGDRIFLDYFGRLSPIDPQAINKNGDLVPALGYLDRWNHFVERARQEIITIPEIQVMLEFDQGDLFSFEHERERSVSLLKEWLVKYKFRDWTRTETRGEDVTPERKAERAEEIARRLSDPDIWHSHGHGIAREVLENDVRLKIDHLEDHPTLYRAVRQYDHLASDYLGERGALLACHVQGCPIILEISREKANARGQD